MTETETQADQDLEAGLVASLEVPGPQTLSPQAAAESLRWNDAPTALMFKAGELDRFVPIDGIEIPPGAAYRGDLDLRPRRQGGMVLGRQPAHVARQRVVRAALGSIACCLSLAYRGSQSAGSFTGISRPKSGTMRIA